MSEHPLQRALSDALDGRRKALPWELDAVLRELDASELEARYEPSDAVGYLLPVLVERGLVHETTAVLTDEGRAYLADWPQPVRPEAAVRAEAEAAAARAREVEAERKRQEEERAEAARRAQATPEIQKILAVARATIGILKTPVPTYLTSDKIRITLEAAVLLSDFVLKHHGDGEPPRTARW